MILGWVKREGYLGVEGKAVSSELWRPEISSCKYGHLGV